MNDAMSVEYTHQQSRCQCHNRTALSGAPTANAVREPLDSNRPVHSLWVAWLAYDNEEMVEERSMRDYAFVSMNWLTTVLTGSPYVHCQLVFWDAVRQRYYTYSVDTQRAVHVWHKKTFARGWTFVRLAVTERQELLVQNFLVDQLGKPLNRLGQLSVLFWSVPGEQKTWFCSELVVAALAHANLVDFAAWPDVSEPSHATPQDIYEYITKHHTRTATHQNIGNPVRARQIVSDLESGAVPKSAHGEMSLSKIAARARQERTLAQSREKSSLIAHFSRFK